MSMMQGGMMGGMHPMHMAMMQQMYGMHPSQLPPPPPPPPGRAGHAHMHGFGAKPPKKKARPRDRRETPANAGDESSSSSSSDSSSESGKPRAAGASQGMVPPTMPGMMGMWPGAPVHSMGGSLHGVEAFLSMSRVDPQASDRLRSLPPHMQQFVMARGPLVTRNATAELITRMREAEMGPPASNPRGRPEFERPYANYANRDDNRIGGGGGGAPAARKSAKVAIEAMVRDYKLSPGCAWMMRSLPPDKQKLASKIDPSGQEDPSGYVAEQLKMIV